MKGFDKVTFVIKTAGNSDLLNGNILGGQQLTGTFYPIVVQIVNGSTFRHAAKIPAEILGIHPGDPGKVLQADAAAVVFGNIGKHFLDRRKPLRRDCILPGIFIQMLI
jgi:hypothetical protein